MPDEQGRYRVHGAGLENGLAVSVIRFDLKCVFLEVEGNFYCTMEVEGNLYIFLEVDTYLVHHAQEPSISFGNPSLG